jgi:hypothetical protein
MVLGLAATANAGIPDLTNSTAAGPASTVQVLITPAGLGSNLAARGATVTVTVRDGNNDPIAGYAFQDIVLDGAISSDLNICPGGSTADGNTDASGVATFSNTIAGGGFTQNGLQVYLGGQPLNGAALNIDVNSPDINGDRTVTVSDVGAFAGDFGSGSFVFRSDFVPDGVLNISDVGRFATAVQEVCP